LQSESLPSCNGRNAITPFCARAPLDLGDALQASYRCEDIKGVSRDNGNRWDQGWQF
jgi:hypothetical protein